MASPSLNFRLPHQMLEWLNATAKKLDRTPGWVAREAIREKMDAESSKREGARSTPAKQANPSNP